MTQGGGPPFQVHVLPQRLPKLTLVGTTTIFAVVNFLKIGSYFALAQFTAKNLAMSLLLLPIAVLANCGHLAGSQNTNRVILHIAYVLLFIIHRCCWQASQR
jgi:hypothetical protein